MRFLQPGVNSVALNRVVGGDPSVILGQLTGNGRIFLSNPSGILFGSGARVNAGGLLATTLKISDADFLAGRYVFQQRPGNSASVINKGTITVGPRGFVALSALGVLNEGTISAHLGTVHLSSGRQLTLDLSKDGPVRFAVDGTADGLPVGPDGQPLASRVSNRGWISADGGAVTLTAKAAGTVMSRVVNNSGIIEARSLVNHMGVVRLIGGDTALALATEAGAMRPAGTVRGIVSNSGTIDVSAAEPGAAPGQVLLLGERVGQRGSIWARGADGARGGVVTITSTERSALFRDSIIDVSGVGSSNAGTVTVWSDRSTYFAAGSAILARGGDRAGDGGFVELSGRESLSLAGLVDAGALYGRPGTLWLDPQNITVALGGAAGLADVDSVTDFPTLSLTVAPATINASIANVVLQASSDITVTDAIAMTNPGVSLTMSAGRTIALNANVGTNAGAISLTAGGSILGGGVLSGASATLRAVAGIIGTRSTPISLAIAGPVNVDAGGKASMVSISLRGSVGGNTVHFPGTVPGLVFFNDRLLSGSKGFELLNTALTSTAQATVHDAVQSGYPTFAARTVMALQPTGFLSPPALFRVEDGGILLPPSLLRLESRGLLAAAFDVTDADLRAGRGAAGPTGLTSGVTALVGKLTVVEATSPSGGGVGFSSGEDSALGILIAAGTRAAGGEEVSPSGPITTTSRPSTVKANFSAAPASAERSLTVATTSEGPETSSPVTQVAQRAPEVGISVERITLPSTEGSGVGAGGTSLRLTAGTVGAGSGAILIASSVRDVGSEGILSGATITPNPSTSAAQISLGAAGAGAPPADVTTGARGTLVVAAATGGTADGSTIRAAKPTESQEAVGSGGMMSGSQVSPGALDEARIPAHVRTVRLSSGQQLTVVDFAGDGLVGFAVEEAHPKHPDNRQPAGSRIEGRAHADAGQVLLPAKAVGDMLAKVVNTGGITEARSLVNRGGVVRLVGGSEVLPQSTAPPRSY